MTTQPVDPPRRRRILNDAPVLPFEYLADDDPIWPCTQCLPWHVEVILRDGEVIVREWHAIECANLLEAFGDEP